MYLPGNGSVRTIFADNVPVSLITAFSACVGPAPGVAVPVGFVSVTFELDSEIDVAPPSQPSSELKSLLTGLSQTPALLPLDGNESNILTETGSVMVVLSQVIRYHL